MAATRIESPDAGYCPSVCSLCLSDSRRTYGVDSVVRHVYRLVTDWSQQKGSRVCWECRARLASIAAFKLQAKEALQLLTAARKVASTELTCLSKLMTTPIMHIDCQLHHEDGQAHTEITEIKEEIDNYEHLQQCNAWIDSVSDSHYDDTEYKNVTMTDLKTSNVESEIQPETEFKMLLNTEITQKGMESIKEKKRKTCTDGSKEKKWKASTEDSKEKKEKMSTEESKEKKRKVCTKDTKQIRNVHSKDTKKKRKLYTFSKNTLEKPLELLKNLIDDSKLEEFEGQTQDVLKARRLHLGMMKSRFRCLLCVEEFKNQFELDKHAANTHSETAGEHACDICSCRFESEQSLGSHRSAHYLLYRCRYTDCDFICNQATRAVWHARRHGHSEIKRTTAPKVFRPRFAEKRLQAEPVHVPDKSTRRRCARCSALGKEKRTTFSCTTCDVALCLGLCWKGYHSVPDLKQNGRTVRRDTKCEICGGEFRSRAYYLHHRNTHLSQQSFECDLCGRSYRTRRQIARHLKNHRMSYMCETCGKRCPSNSALKAHSLAHMDYSLRDFECGECSKKFINKHKLLSHLKYHSGDRPFKCSDCHREYTDVYQLKFHKKQHHSAEGNDIKTKTKWKRTMSLHRNKPLRTQLAQPPTDAKVQSDAENPINHECHICGKVFKDKVCLRTHFSVHSDARPYKCDECGKSFKVYPALYTHKYLHTGVKPYQCNICGAQFALKGNLSWHVRTHSDEKPFDCHICNRKFKFPSNLAKHVKIHDVVVK